jgi:hypothetical protein
MVAHCVAVGLMYISASAPVRFEPVVRVCAHHFSMRWALGECWHVGFRALVFEYSILKFFEAQNQHVGGKSMF